jgi:hypothetical protein
LLLRPSAPCGERGALAPVEGGPFLCPLTGHTSCGNALAIGGVEQHDAGLLARGHALQGIAATELDGMRHTGALGVALGKVHHAVRHVAAKNEGRIALLEAFLAFCACSARHLSALRLQLRF